MKRSRERGDQDQAYAAYRATLEAIVIILDEPLARHDWFPRHGADASGTRRVDG